MSMTKKDYELIAGALESALKTWTPDTQERRTAIYAIKDVTLTLAKVLHDDNPKFDGTKFLQIAGVE